MNEHKGLPVAGYKPQSDEKVQTVNGFKQDEERILRKLDELMQASKMATQGVVIDPCWLAIGRTQLEQAFMAINRAVFQPGRVVLPEDVDARPSGIVSGGFAPIDTKRTVFRSSVHNGAWCFSKTETPLTNEEIAAYVKAGRL